MPTVPANGITIDYETYGDPSDPALLLIHGLGAQRTDWRQSAIDRFVDQGLFVVTFDNRDQGGSTWFDDAGLPDLMAMLFGEGATPAYLLADMAADAAGLLDALELDRVHVLGVSMGGMISQQFVIDFPERVATLTSIMSTPSTSVGPPTEEAQAALLAPPAEGRAAVIEQSIEVSRIIGSPGFAFDEDDARARAAIHYDRGHHPDGTQRQLAAILCSPDRTEGLGKVAVPTLVLHGEADPLITLPGGEATAAAIPNAELWVVPGMGHDLPEPVVEELVVRHQALIGQLG